MFLILLPLVLGLSMPQLLDLAFCAASIVCVGIYYRFCVAKLRIQGSHNVGGPG